MSSTQNQRHRDIHFMDPLCVWSNILAIIPPYRFTSKCHESKNRAFNKWYTLFVFMLVMILNGLSIMGRFKYVYSVSLSVTLIVTDLAVNLSLTVTNFSTILGPSFWHLEDFQTFYEVFTKIDSYLFKSPLIVINKCKAFYIELVVGHLTLMFIFVYDAYVWTTGVNFQSFRNYIFRDFQHYHIFITVMTMYNFIVSMQYRFEIINNTLRMVAKLPSSKDSTAYLHIKMEKSQIHQSVRQIAQVYETQIMQIALFNKIFGWQILLLTLSIMMGLLNALDILTTYSFLKYDKTGSPVLGYDLIVLSVLWSSWQLLMGVVIVASCNKASKKAQETADICFSILLKVPVVAERTEEKSLRHELFLLSQIAVHRCPTFSAAGFFSVDFSLLLAIFGSVTTYVIVIIQFNK